MGMYDEVDIWVACPVCGQMVHGFQTKDLECMLDTYRIGSWVADVRRRVQERQDLG